jgi:DNA-binding transcriptional MerR regulator
MKKTGMSIKDIKAFSDLYKQGDFTIDQRLDMFIQRQRDLEKQIDEFQKTLDIIKYKIWYYETAKETGTTEIHKTIKEEDIPEEIREIRAIMEKKKIY